MPRTMTSRGVRPAVLAAASCALAALLLAGAAAAEELRVGREARTAVALTVYQQDLAMVDERRRVRLAAGTNDLALEDVGAGLQPETLRLAGPGLRVVEQAFAFDLLSPQRLLEASVGRTVRVIRTHPQTGEETVVDARLLAIAQGPVLRIGDRIETEVPGRIAFDRIPEGLRERPTLLARVDSAAAGEAELELSYLTGGLSWRADYVVELAAAGDRIDLTGLVTLANRSGVRFDGAALRLVAGEVSQVPGGPEPGAMRAMMESAVAMPQAAPAPQAAGDRYVYALDRAVDLGDRETKQVVLLGATGVAARREYRFETLVSAEPGIEEVGPVSAAIALEIENTEAAGLGRPLPAGTVRVYESGAPGGRMFAGADRIGHTAAGERVTLGLGRAFDVTGQARRTAYERLSDRSYETAQEIAVRNARDKAVEVRLIGHLPPGWRMLRESAPHEAETANRIVWRLEVPAKGETTLTYRVRVSR